MQVDDVSPDDFFFSSRRRHTRCYRDWSSDVCSSDLSGWRCRSSCSSPSWKRTPCCPRDRKSVVEGKSVDLGGRRIIKKKKERRDEGAAGLGVLWHPNALSARERIRR